jgi:rubrerythrin
MLSGKGFEHIYNLSGGIKAWQKAVAVGPEDTGMHLFTGDESATDAIIIGFGLECGLQQFYQQMTEKISRQSAKQLFSRLADIEVLHQERLLALYKKLSGEDELTLASFKGKVVHPEMEGGLTTEQYLALYDLDFQSELDILGMAMSIEAQALDLYLRAAGKAGHNEAGEVLFQIAQEERSHMARLGQYIDQQQDLK